MRGFITGIVALALTGCKVPKDVAYFQDVDSSVILQTAQNAPITVKPGDKLSIIVKSKDPQLSALFNLPVYSSRVGQEEARTGRVPSCVHIPEASRKAWRRIRSRPPERSISLCLAISRFPA